MYLFAFLLVAFFHPYKSSHSKPDEIHTQDSMNGPDSSMIIIST